MTKIAPYIRWMIRRDMPAVLAIEEAAFGFPWSEEDFIRVLRQRNCIAMAAEQDERILGYMVYELHATKLVILNFAVHPGAWLKGVGRAMVNKLVGKLSPQRRSRIETCVRESNLDAQLFFRACGFRCIATRRDHYEVSPEDGYVFCLRHREQQNHGACRTAGIAG